MATNQRNQKCIDTIKESLKSRFNISSDRDLLVQLGIKPEDKEKLFLWIKYQNAFSYAEGYENGQENLKFEINNQIGDLLKSERDYF